jgi:NAD(P)H-nitrite reductase large subunit
VSPDDEICCCHHVSLRKLTAFALRTRPRVASQMSECLGAGTGCGWCIPILDQIARSARDGQSVTVETDVETYRAQRAAYRERKESD